MKKQIDSELKHIAVKVPFNKAVIACANPYQAVSFCLTGIPKGVNHRKFVVAGYKGLECRVDVFEPLNGEKVCQLCFMCMEAHSAIRPPLIIKS